MAAATRTTTPTTTSDIVVYNDITITCSDGIQLSAQIWKRNPNRLRNKSCEKQVEEPSNRRRRLIVCLHGWMDNCRSFHYLAPNLLLQLQSQQEQQQQQHANGDGDTNNDDILEILALDLPGHGWSSHKSLDAPPTLFSESIYYIAEVLQKYSDNLFDINNNHNNETTATTITTTTTSHQMPLEKINDIVFIGHSMGAAIGCLYAATYPEQIQQLILLDNAGPMARETNDFIKHLRKGIDKRLSSTKSLQQQRIYSSINEAVKVRMSTPKQFPGNQYISEATATELVLRGTKPTLSSIGNSNTIQGYIFRHDVRLQWPSIQYFTNEQVDVIYRSIVCPTLLLIAHDGFPFPIEKQQHIQQQFSNNNGIVIKTLPGSHHFHSDPDTCRTVIDEIAAFMIHTGPPLLRRD